MFVIIQLVIDQLFKQKFPVLRIRVRKVPFRFFDKLKNEIQNSILRFCFYFNKEDESNN